MLDPDIQNLINTLLLKGNKKAPLAELGIHPTIKEKLMGRPIKTLKDDVDFWHQAGYDYIKLQPGVDFNPDGIGLSGKVTFNEDGSVNEIFIIRIVN